MSRLEEYAEWLYIRWGRLTDRETIERQQFHFFLATEPLTEDDIDLIQLYIAELAEGHEGE